MQATRKLREKRRRKNKPPKSSQNFLPTPCTPLGAPNLRKIIGNLNKLALIMNPDLLVKALTCNVNVLELVSCTQWS